MTLFSKEEIDFIITVLLYKLVFVTVYIFPCVFYVISFMSAVRFL